MKNTYVKMKFLYKIFIHFQKILEINVKST